MANASMVWQERAWVWGTRLLVIGALGLLTWWLTRRGGWSAGAESQRPVLPFLSSRG
jgi:hypothetical protein